MKKCKCGSTNFHFYKTFKINCEMIDSVLKPTNKEDKTKSNDQFSKYVYCSKCSSRYLRKDFNIINNVKKWYVLYFKYYFNYYIIFPIFNLLQYDK